MHVLLYARLVDTVKSDSLHTVELHGTMLKVQSFDADLLYWAGTYGDNITSNGEFCINFLSRLIALRIRIELDFR